MKEFKETQMSQEKSTDFKVYQYESQNKIIFATTKKITYGADFQNANGKYSNIRKEIIEKVHQNKDRALHATVYYNDSPDYKDDLENTILYNLKIKTQNFRHIILNRKPLNKFSEDTNLNVNNNIKCVYDFKFKDDDFDINSTSNCSFEIGIVLPQNNKQLKIDYFNQVRKKIEENTDNFCIITNSTRVPLYLKIEFLNSGRKPISYIKQMIDGIISACHIIKFDKSNKELKQRIIDAQLKLVNENYGFIETENLFTLTPKTFKWNPHDDLIDMLEIVYKYDNNTNNNDKTVEVTISIVKLEK